MNRIKELLRKYKFVAIILAVGMIFLLWPENEQSEMESLPSDTFSLDSVERKMEQMLGNMSGVGRVQVMLTLKSGNTLQLATDNETSDNRVSREVVKLNRNGSSQEVVITEQIYPVYLGAVVVCDGAENSTVCLGVKEVVSVLTGLGSDRISVVKWQQ